MSLSTAHNSEALAHATAGLSAALEKVAELLASLD